VGSGVLESRSISAQATRIYFGRDGNRLVILLAGGTKKHQRTDIEAAKAHWADYNRCRQ
jgi:putative addiction module killer protein